MYQNSKCTVEHRIKNIIEVVNTVTLEKLLVKAQVISRALKKTMLDRVCALFLWETSVLIWRWAAAAWHKFSKEIISFIRILGKKNTLTPGVIVCI